MNTLSRIMWLAICILFAVIAIDQDSIGVGMQFINAALLCAVLYFLEKIVQAKK